MDRRVLQFGLLLGCVFLLRTPATAQDAVGDKIVSFFSSAEYSFSETYVGEAGVARGTKAINDFDEDDLIMRFVLTPRVKIGVLRIGFEWERFWFGFPNSAPLPDTLQSIALVMGLDTQLSDSILLRVEAQPGMYNTGVASLSDDFNMPFIAGGTYIYNPNLQFIAGVSVDVERKYPVLPAAGVRWKFARQWVINAVLPTPRLEYEWNKSLTLYGGGEFKETNFRMPDDFGDRQGRPQLNHAVLTYSEVRAGGGCEWKITNDITLSAETGYQPYRGFDFYRTNIRYHQNEAAPYGMVALHGAF